MKRLWLLSTSLISALLISAPVHADSPKGLSITPTRMEQSVAAGKTSTGSFIVGNQTDEPIVVRLSVKQFSVTDYAYDYVFQNPKDDHVKLRDHEVRVEAHATKRLWYDVTFPRTATPGGYYYAIFASTDVAQEGSAIAQTVQATTLLYVKLGGKFIYTSVWKNDSLPFVVMGSDIPYKFDLKNTGNVHFTGLFYGQVEGLFGKGQEVGVDHLLMPGAVRSISGTVPSPIMPGIYRVTYGYKVDFASIINVKSAYIIYLPPWSIAFAMLIAYALWRSRNRWPAWRRLHLRKK